MNFQHFSELNNCGKLRLTLSISYLEILLSVNSEPWSASNKERLFDSLILRLAAKSFFIRAISFSDIERSLCDFAIQLTHRTLTAC